MKNGIKTLAMWLIIGVIFIVVLTSIVENSETKLKYSDLIANINSETKELLIKPNITTRGFILVNENEELIKELENFAYKVISKNIKENNNLNAVKPRIISEIIPFVEQKTGRRPIILPILTEIDPKKL